MAAANDIRTLTNALCRVPSLPPSLWKHQERNLKMYSHIATLLTRDGMSEEETDLVLDGVAMYKHFALFAFEQSPSSQSRIRFTSRRSSGNDSLVHIIEQGLQPTNLMTHCSNVLDILWAFAGLDLSEEAREIQQSKCLIFLIQRSLGHIILRFHKPKQFYCTDDTSWWKLLALWVPDHADSFPVRELRVKPHIALIFNALSPDLLPSRKEVVLDAEMASKCVLALAVLLDVIDGKLVACQAPTRTADDWEKLNTTLRMLYCLLYETEILRHIFHHASFSSFLLSRANQFRGEKPDGALLFRELQAVTAWQRAVLMVSGTKIIRAGVPIEFNIVSVPRPRTETTPIMDLVKEVYPSWRLNTLAHIKAYLEPLLLLEDPPSFTSHHHADVMGVFIAVDAGLRLEEQISDTHRLWALKEGMVQILSTCKNCCYTCDKLALLLAVDGSPNSPPSVVFAPWSPPPGTPTNVLEALRVDLMAELKRHLDCVVATAWSSEEEQSPSKYSHGQLSVLQIIETLGEICS